LLDGAFCRLGSSETDDDDDDDDDDDNEDPVDVYEDNVTAPAPAPAPAAAVLPEDEDVDEDDEEPEVNATAVTVLLQWEEGMTAVVNDFESGIHPHGKKWWRYRYEYTLLESLVLAFAVLVLYCMMYLLSGVSFIHKFKFYKIGLTTRLYRYFWSYVVFHAAALMIMTTITYLLYMPWGETNLFDIGAKALHEAVDGRANVPYLGYSWLLLCLDVHFQLFACFCLYSLHSIRHQQLSEGT